MTCYWKSYDKGNILKSRIERWSPEKLGLKSRT